MMIRVFVAVHVPRTEAADGLRSDLKAAGARTVPPDQTHITLSFIGDIDEKKVGRITECVRRAVDGFSPFEVSVSGTGAFPNESRPSVVWMGVEPAGLLRGIARNLDGALTAAGIGHDSKPFKAHVTVARCRDGLLQLRVQRGPRHEERAVPEGRGAHRAGEGPAEGADLTI